jgi:hypothetical protein
MTRLHREHKQSAPPPISKAKLTVLLGPELEPLLVRVIKLDALWRNALQDIVEFTLGDVEHGRVTFRNVPVVRHTRSMTAVTP